MRKTLKLLAFDFGASSARALLASFDGKSIKLEEVHRFRNQPVLLGDRLYWDFPFLFSELKKGVAKAVAKSEGKVKSIGIDSWGVDFALLDKNGRLIANPVHYRDSRTKGIMQKVFEIVPKKEIFYKTAVQFLPFNTLYQLYSLFCESPEILKTSSKLLMIPDLFNYFLCGEKLSEFTIATTTQFFDPRKKSWSKSILEKLSIPSHILPEVIEPATVLGNISKSVSMETQAKNLKLIAPCCHDTASAVASVPAKKNNWAYISSGTWSLLGAEVHKPVINDKVLKLNFTNEGGAEGTFRLLKNISGLWIFEQVKAVWEKNEKRKFQYKELLEEAKRAKPFNFLIDPDAPDFMNPQNMLSAIEKYCVKTEQKVPKTKGEFVRGILESLALKYRLVLKELNQILPEPVKIIHIVGGGAKNEMLSQWTADACELPAIAGPEEATSLGNILLQLIALKELKNLNQARDLISSSFRLKKYLPENSKPFRDAEEKLLKISSKTSY